jgi:hypothetical protein
MQPLGDLEARTTGVSIMGKVFQHRKPGDLPVERSERLRGGAAALAPRLA